MSVSLDLFKNLLLDKISGQIMARKSRQETPYGSGYNTALSDAMSIIEAVKQENSGAFAAEISAAVHGFGVDHTRLGVKFCVMITTYNRPEPFYQLTKRLKEINPDCIIVAVDDHSDVTPSFEYVDDYLINPSNLGKQGYWKTVNKLWALALGISADYYIMLPDDCFPNDNIFEAALFAWRSIGDEKKIAVSLINNGREQNWTGFVKQDYNESVDLTNNTETLFMSTHEFISYKIPEIHPSVWESNPKYGSGVGSRLCNYWVGKDRTIYSVKNSLVFFNPMCEESVMHPEVRKEEPAIVLSSNRKVAGLATIPSRLTTLEQVIKSLHGQVDVIELSLNGFSSVPDFLSNYPKVYATIRSNDMGDANKFANVEKYPNDYYFSCDDDLVYPKNYVETLLKEINKRKCLITVHGSRIESKRLKSYYKGRTFVSHCLRDAKEERVHIPGSGVSGFHTGTLKIKYSDLTEANMADIFLGIACERQRVKRIAIAHKANWLGYLNPDEAQTIHGTSHKSDKKQTELVNSVEWAAFS